MPSDKLWILHYVPLFLCPMPYDNCRFALCPPFYAYVPLSMRHLYEEGFQTMTTVDFGMPPFYAYVPPFLCTMSPFLCPMSPFLCQTMTTVDLRMSPFLCLCPPFYVHRHRARNARHPPSRAGRRRPPTDCRDPLPPAPRQDVSRWIVGLARALRDQDDEVRHRIARASRTPAPPPPRWPGSWPRAWGPGTNPCPATS